jgi:pantoate--beta-alanine ligase
MRVIRSVLAMQRFALAARRAGARIGCVPTMGFLHEGHLSLVKRARRAVGPKGIVVLTIYVNPTQFAPHEDLAKYPRDFARDAKLCRAAGVDVIFAPADADMYPGRAEGRYSTYVVEEKLSLGMEGVSRPTHFRGVTTVVAKLFNLVLPDVAVFGAKDWQQAAIVQRMVADLNFPLRIIVAPTVRERDGLAMSSRNKYLGPEERIQATVLSRTIRRAQALAKVGAYPTAKLKTALARFIATEAPLGKLDYVEVFDPETLQPATTARPGSHLALAVFFGKTRLIDNGRL